MADLKKTLPKIMTEEVSVRGLGLQNFEPFSKCIVVEPLPPETTFGGVLVIPENQREKQKAGVVRKISPYDNDGPFGVGDIVLYADSTGTDVKFGDKAMKIMQWHSIEEADILGRWPAKSVDKQI